MPMFPDSGVPPGDAKNSIDVNTVPGCPELWYSTSRCQPRFDPAAANAMLAEDMNLIMKGEVVYDCATLNNIERAVRYINQRGLPRACVFTAGPFDYIAALDPGITRHSDFMTLTVVPNVDNQGATTLNLGLGAVPVRRNDGLPLKSKDLLAGKPAIIAYWQGAWYLCGLASSQVPLVVIGGVDAWIRTDGNDVTGDGTANTPDKAFRTIQGCWNAVGSRYAASPLFSINMRLGIPGDYAGAQIGPFGGVASLTGDPANPTAYRIHCVDYTYSASALWLSNISIFYLSGVNLIMDMALGRPNGNFSLLASGTSVSFIGHCQLTLEATTVPQTTSVFIAQVSAGFGCSFGVNIIIEGNGHSCISGIGMALASMSYGVGAGGAPANWFWRNITFLAGGHAINDQSVFRINNTTYTSTNTVGKRYEVSGNSILSANGLILPGNAPGTVGSQGQFFP